MIPVHVTAGPGVEIVVLNSALEKVSRGVGPTLRLSLAPGLYRFRFKAADTLRDVDQVVLPSTTALLVTQPPLTFTSPVPLPDTRGFVAAVAAAAEMASVSAPAGTGGPGRLFVFVRLPDAAPHTNIASIDRLRSAMDQLELTDADGRSVPAFRSARAYGDVGVAWVHIAVPPGTYCLQQARRTEVKFLTWAISVAADWQTQVFATLEQGESAPDSHAQVDIANASVLMAPPAQGFRHDSGSTRITELVRLGLALDKVVVSKEALSLMLDGVFADPMLGIYLAHNLLVRPVRGDQGRVLELLSELALVLPDHPDVMALRLRVQSRSGAERSNATSLVITAPPMLMRSWGFIVRQSARFPALVPKGTLAADIASRLWGGGPWLIWHSSKTAAAAPPRPLFEAPRLRLRGVSASPPSSVPLGASVSRAPNTASVRKSSAPPSLSPLQPWPTLLKHARLATVDAFGRLAQHRALNEVEQALLEHTVDFARRVSGSSSGLALGERGAAAQTRSVILRLARRLGMPPAAVTDLAAEVATKLESERDGVSE